jgi:hypothetical protein
MGRKTNKSSMRYGLILTFLISARINAHSCDHERKADGLIGFTGFGVGLQAAL